MSRPFRYGRGGSAGKPDDEMLDEQPLPLKFPNLARFGLAATGIGFWGLLLVARLLQPAGEGIGTHTQLGLPECGFVRMTGAVCPSCGMTTSWSYLTRGQIGMSLQTNPGGTLMGLAALLCGPWFFASGLLGRWYPGPLGLGWLLGLLGILMAVTLTQWIVRIVV